MLQSVAEKSVLRNLVTHDGTMRFFKAKSKNSFSSGKQKKFKVAPISNPGNFHLNLIKWLIHPFSTCSFSFDEPNRTYNSSLKVFY